MTNTPSFFSRNTYTGRQENRNARRLMRDSYLAIANYRIHIAMAIAAVCVIIALPWELRIFMSVAILMAQDYDWSGLLDKFQEARRDRRAHQNIQEDALDNDTQDNPRDNSPDKKDSSTNNTSEPLHNSLNQCFPKVAMSGFDNIHPAVYRLYSMMRGTKSTNHQQRPTRAESHENNEVEYCRGFYPSLPTDRIKAWEWLARQDGPRAYEFFCPCG